MIHEELIADQRNDGVIGEKIGGGGEGTIVALKMLGGEIVTAAAGRPRINLQIARFTVGSAGFRLRL